MSEQSLESLETRIAYQDDAIEQLSDTLYRQTMAIERLEQRCQALENRLQALAEAGEGSDEDAPPPHY
ncbi:SlyX family protein [Salinisphaera sp. T31B1]|uniref:SlyX family protein n=1 Tax=Salinisphaera sp. T31B1 TaxID=727963 RepID=UPI00333FD1A5